MGVTADSLAGEASVSAGARTAVLSLRRPSREAYCLFAIVTLGVGASLNYGAYVPAALALVVLGIGAILLIPSGTPARASPLSWSFAVGLGAIASVIVYGGSPLIWLTFLAAGGLAVTVVLCPQRAVRRAAAAVSGAIALGLLWASVQWGRAHIDTFWFIQRASARLLSGLNPYGASWRTTTPGLASAHFTFGPGVLLLSLPGRLLGDIRVSDLLAILVLVASVVALARRHGGPEQGWRCLAICLTLPFLPYMINRSWAEVYLAAAIAVWLWWRERHPWAAVVVLGLGLSTVPTAVPLLALPFLWWSRPRREILVATLLAAVICLPFALWAGPAHFVSDIVGLEVRQPPRFYGLDFDAAWVRLTGTWFPGWVWPAVTLTVLILISRTRDRTWSSAFLLGAGFMGVSLLFAKWAFFDYYFVIAVGLILGLALQSWREPQPSTGIAALGYGPSSMQA